MQTCATWVSVKYHSSLPWFEFGFASELRAAIPVWLGGLRGKRALHHLDGVMSSAGCRNDVPVGHWQQEIPKLLLDQRAPVLLRQDSIMEILQRARCRKSAECCCWRSPGSPVKRSTERCSQTFKEDRCNLLSPPTFSVISWEWCKECSLSWNILCCSELARRHVSQVDKVQEVIPGSGNKLEKWGICGQNEKHLLRRSTRVRDPGYSTAFVTLQLHSEDSEG